MLQKIGTGKPSKTGWYDSNRYRKCHFCRKNISKGEEWIGMGMDMGKSMHRVCLDNWLRKHPPLNAPCKILSDEEAEAEFEKIRRKLMRKARSKTSS